MGLSPANYTRLLINLLPKGKFWENFKTRGKDAYKTLQAIAEEFSRINGRALNLLDEADPNTTLELVSDWERVVGLPDNCQDSVAEDIIDRRNDIVRKLSARGGSSHKFFIDLAATIDYPITIEEFRQFRSGRNRSGDRIYGEEWLFYWRINTPSVIIRYFRSGQGRSGDRLATWRDSLLECAINDKRPAHTKVIFTYGG